MSAVELYGFRFLQNFGRLVISRFSSLDRGGHLTRLRSHRKFSNSLCRDFFRSVENGRLGRNSSQLQKIFPTSDRSVQRRGLLSVSRKLSLLTIFNRTRKVRNRYRFDGGVERRCLSDHRKTVLRHVSVFDLKTGIGRFSIFDRTRSARFDRLDRSVPIVNDRGRAYRLNNRFVRQIRGRAVSRIPFAHNFNRTRRFDRFSFLLVAICVDVGRGVGHVEEVAERVVPDLVDDAHQRAGGINAVLVVAIWNK